jgi:hypothetical protein
MTNIALTTPTVEVNGNPCLMDRHGSYIPLENVKATDKMEDQLVRGIFGYAIDLNAQISRFRNHCEDDIAAHQTLVSEQYGATGKGGRKGNMSFTSFDGCLQVQIAVADKISFGTELASAKELFDACLMEWGAEAHPAIRQLLQDAFNTEKTGQVSRDLIFRLLRTEVDDPRWKEAQRALKDSIRPEGTKEYIRFRRRARPTDKWENVTIDIASTRAGSAAHSQDAAD